MTSHRTTIRRRLAGGALTASLLWGTAPAGAIIGGAETTLSEHTYFVRLERRFTPTGPFSTRCGASVVDVDWVLTAAHCVAGVNPDFIRANGWGFSSGVEIQVHPLWNGRVSHGHDLALLRLEPRTTEVAARVQVGSLLDPSVYRDLEPATALGHGYTRSHGQVTKELRRLDVRLRSDDHMDDVYNHWYWFDNWRAGLMIGAGNEQRTVCEGDSGGPLTVSRGGKPVQVGVTSFAYEDCDQPGGFSELRGAHLAWLGSMVDIRFGWGTCYDERGAAGVHIARWDTTWSSATPNLDSAYMNPWYSPTKKSFYWGFTCHVEPVPTTGGGTYQPPPTTGGGAYQPPATGGAYQMP